MPYQVEVPDHLYPALQSMLRVSAKKRNDYSGVGPWQNFRNTSDFFNLPKWMSAIFNCVQKLERVRTLSDGREVKNEPLEDTLLDLANYALFAYAMYLEDGTDSAVISADTKPSGSPNTTSNLHYPPGVR